MKTRPVKIYKWLLPLSWLYGSGVWLRNKLFDIGYTPSKKYDMPVICVGNLAVGGTGKTPHTEYLIRLLCQQGLHVATLSRGYKRNSKGYLLADETSTAQQIGDEPCQMKNKFPYIQVAVDEKRCHGIEQLQKLDNPPIDVILLDDAYQHRHVKAGLNILLTDCQRLFCDDALMPAGRLREPQSRKDRAQIIIVTKCPQKMKPIDFKIISKKLRLYPYQQLYFTKLAYGALIPLFPQLANGNKMQRTLKGDDQVLLVTGIASPTALLKEISAYVQHVDLLAFGDHHDFCAKDLQQIKQRFACLKEGNRIIITTEKDAERLKLHPAMAEELKPFIYIIPIEIEFLQGQQSIFNQNIIDYVKANSRNCSLLKE